MPATLEAVSQDALVLPPTSALRSPVNSWRALILSQSQAPKRRERPRLPGASHALGPATQNPFPRERSLPGSGRLLPTDQVCAGVPPGSVRRSRVRHGRLRGPRGRYRSEISVPRSERVMLQLFSTRCLEAATGGTGGSTCRIPSLRSLHHRRGTRTHHSVAHSSRHPDYFKTRMSREPMA